MTKDRQPSLIVFSGLPGTGKTTVSKALAARLFAVYLRIDTIEQAKKAAGADRIGAAGYAAANGVAEANLLLGHSVVADCVNPVRESRLGWRGVAARALAFLIELHLVWFGCGRASASRGKAGCGYFGACFARLERCRRA